MKLDPNFFSLFKKYPSIRFVFLVLTVLLIVFTVSYYNDDRVRLPEIDSITPQFGNPGEIMEISGRNFGSVRDSAYVEIGGSRLTSKSYLSWSDSRIEVVLPSNVQDGLVVVVTDEGRSQKNSFFANSSGIPVAVPLDAKTVLPTITSVTPSNGTLGSVITISGSNFGAARNNSLVYFSTERKGAKFGENSENMTSDEKLELDYVRPYAENYDFEVWSDTEIQVRIPDGAESGILFVKTERGISNQYPLDIKNTVGKREYSNLRSYIIQINSDIEDVNSVKNASLSLRVPRPFVCTRQPYVDLRECTPEPSIRNYDNTVCHMIDLSKAMKKKSRFAHKFIVSSYSLETKINEKNVKAFSKKERPSFNQYLAAEDMIPSEDESIVALANAIVKKEKNPYKKAKLIYNYMIENYEILDSVRSADADPLELLKTGSGDAYDYAVCYAALLRACEIPAIPISGILIDADKKSKSHWWCEFYISNFGWVPVDVALGDSLAYNPFGKVENAVEYYFGNMDSQHIVFSRGFKTMRSTLANSNVVYRPKTYAFQSIWEETTGGHVNYSSLWNDPVVVGIY